MDEVELKRQLTAQMDFLRSSATAYDDGQVEEAVRLAAVVRTLCHSAGQAVALLTQLGILITLSFVDTCLPPMEPPPVDESGQGLQWVAFDFGLAPVSGGPHGFNPMLDPSPHGSEKPFDEWWNSDVVADTQHKLSRRRIVLDLAHKDGGAHVDLNRLEDYDAITRGGSLGTVTWIVAGGAVESTAGKNPLYGHMRQIAYEVEQSIAPLVTPNH